MEKDSPGGTPRSDPGPLTSEIETPPRVLPERSPIAGFWRRIFAHLLDVLILGAFGFLLGTVFGGFFSTLGEWGRLVGFPVATFYYGYLNSVRGRGQTMGKRLLRLRVVGEDGEGIALGRSLGRGAILAVEYLSLLPVLFPTPIISPRLIVFLVTSAIGFGLFYFYLVNGRTRQSLHDLIFRTYVVRADADRGVTPARVASYHYVIWLTVFALLFAGTVQISRLVFTWLAPVVDLPGLQVTQRALLAHPRITDAAVYEGTATGGEGSLEYLRVNVRWKGIPPAPEAAIREVAAIAAASYPGFDAKDRVSIEISTGYDIGIASSTRTEGDTATPEEWRTRLRPVE